VVWIDDPEGGYPAPNSDATARASDFIEELKKFNASLEISSEADVLGGVDVYIDGPILGRSVWCFFRNTGGVTAVFDDHSKIFSEPWPVALARVADFLIHL